MAKALWVHRQHGSNLIAQEKIFNPSAQAQYKGLK